jgi:hypothetical protein
MELDRDHVQWQVVVLVALAGRQLEQIISEISGAHTTRGR